ncbi:MAG TPA: bifunctional phosphoribosylaminoimidazolecarboxamide formyltransferase/IMP cyclohydrolase [Pirellulales bacterium]|jgi:phosphoribosylaminoimidazolecarboxamide formyltransferase/IMP cyclohydrolase|nr:bifunctional phosphoribosylaminoimidazolecarboxamide formyltransferase/IMP cyclohydrolase [Pirellulales bacterium]
MESPRIERALLSVSDKTGLAAVAHGLAARNVELFSTGGTRHHLQGEGLAVRDVAAYTGFPEMMGGRIKTLHPKIHGGILCRRDEPDDLAAIEAHGIVPFELVVVNLYPFEATLARGNVTRTEAIEQIDIGGPSLVRAAAKNHAFVTVATSPEQYAAILSEIEATGTTTPQRRFQLAGAAFAHTAHYDAAIADYFARPDGGEPFPQTLRLEFHRRELLRYGENPHQRAALFAEPNAAGATVVTARQLHGKELSYNNLLDLDSALAIVRTLPGAAAVVIKHNNPCGASSAEALAVAARRALDGDAQSAFGSVLGFNRPFDAATAEVLVEPGRFIEAIAAPEFLPAALEILTTRPKWKANVRLMDVGAFETEPARWDYRRLGGGLLVQEADVAADAQAEWKVVTRRAPAEAEYIDLRFGWAVVRHVKSNAIVLARERTLLGTGAGQMSRVDSVQIALSKAGASAAGAALASDAFFPFADSIHSAAKAGVTSVIQPGGSRNDAEVIAACDEHAMAMVFTGRRHFRH